MALTFPSSPTPGQTYVGPNNITYTWDNTLGVWTGSSPGAGGLTAASLAQAAAGTLNTVASTPQTAVPKDASGMTGAALIPTGTLGQRPTPVAGMLRMNTSLSPDSLEAYDGTTSSWRQIAYEPQPPAGLTDLTLSANGPLISGTFNNYTVNSGVTATLQGLVVIRAYGNVTINGTINGVGQGLPAPTSSVGISGAGGGMAGVNGYGLGAGLAGGILSAPSNFGGPVVAPDYLLGSTGTPGAVYGLSGVNQQSSGGFAGGSLMIRCYGTLTIAGTAAINVSGANGQAVNNPGGVGSAGGGGGSGGLIYLQGETLNVAGTLTSSGGNGANALDAYSGGGGGGGGYIILVSPKAITDTSTKTVAGGSFGASINVPGSGGAGGGFGGAGGANGVAGSTGQILTNYFL